MINNGEFNVKGPVHHDLNWMNIATRSVRDTGIIPKSYKMTVISTALSGIEAKCYTLTTFSVCLTMMTAKKNSQALTKVMW